MRSFWFSNKNESRVGGLKHQLIKIGRSFCCVFLVSSMVGYAAPSIAGETSTAGQVGVITQQVKLPTSFSGSWRSFGRAEISTSANSVTIANGSVADLSQTGDCVMSFRARGVKENEPVQIWGAIRMKNREDRYVFGLRGGVEPELSFARYAADGKSRNLGFASLDFQPKPGEWYRLRVEAAGRHFQIYLNDETLPRINITDDQNGWDDGGVALGGGWLPTEFSDFKLAPLTDAERAAFNAVGEKKFGPPPIDKEALREKQRAAWSPVRIASLPETRGEFSLDGNWLFMPDGNIDAAAATGPADDRKWHVMPVPAFWTFSYAWLFGEVGFPDLSGPSAYRSPSDLATQEEFNRLNALTFDWEKTKSAWYRQMVELPADLNGKKFSLDFGGVAKISEIWVNGKKVGANTGMYREIDCDITEAVKPGKNMIAVHVIANPDQKIINSKKSETEAVTVKVTSEMMQALPHGMMQYSAAGIWQPVKLVVTDPLRIGEINVQTATNQATIAVEVINGSVSSKLSALSYQIRDAKDDSVLCSGETKELSLATNGKAAFTITTPKLSPKLWTPQTPNLYKLVLSLADGTRVADHKEIRIGFRTFAVDGNRFLLNGKPYWLRGGNHTPAILRPNDGDLARRFFEAAHAGNVWLTRSHCQPFTEAWLDAADEVGMGVSFEGTWPWLMIKGEPPSPEMIKIWQDEFINMMKRYRNHPSVLMWTVNNEMNFARFDENDTPLLKRKWQILDNAIKEMRRTDPTRPISAYSGYVREEAQKGYDDVVAPNKFDDGDIDDVHTYNGWYSPSFFSLYGGEFGKRLGTAGRPLISQEISTGYPRGDGWAARSYVYNRYVAQALVGNYAFEQNDPAIFLTRQSFLTKELTEAIRRTSREQCAGLMPFAYLTWFSHVWKTNEMQPLKTYGEIAKAMQPVLVSAELFGRHFYAGSVVKRRVCVVNDAENYQATSPGNLNWEIRAGENVLAQGCERVPAVDYYSNHWFDVDFQMPTNLPLPRVDAKLVISLGANGQVLGKNDYDVVIATHEWALPKVSEPLAVFDPHEKSKSTLAGLPIRQVSPGNIPQEKLLIVGDLVAALKQPNETAELKKYVEQGGRLLLLQPGASLCDFLPDFVKSYRATKGEVVNMVVPESAVFDGIEPLDLAWFELGSRKTPLACAGTWEVNRACPEIEPLADQCDFHTQILFGSEKQLPFFNIAGAPLVEIHLGKGMVIASEMVLDAQDKDPIAARLLRNILDTLKNNR
jgi:Glycosyl hydrolases family 2, sugar binding domain/Glycosyl hydrolases family 2/Glycosyl hydrolases family 2, TIM barrel domain